MLSISRDHLHTGRPPKSPHGNSQLKVQLWLDCIEASHDTEPHLSGTQQTLHPRKQMFRGHPVILQGLLLKRGKFNISYKVPVFRSHRRRLSSLSDFRKKDSPSRPESPSYDCTYKSCIIVGKDAEVRDGGIDSEMPTILIRVPQRHGLRSSRTYRIAASTFHEHQLWLLALTPISELRHSPGLLGTITADGTKRPHHRISYDFGWKARIAAEAGLYAGPCRPVARNNDWEGSHRPAGPPSLPG